MELSQSQQCCGRRWIGEESESRIDTSHDDYDDQQTGQRHGGDDHATRLVYRYRQRRANQGQCRQRTPGMSPLTRVDQTYLRIRPPGEGVPTRTNHVRIVNEQEIIMTPPQVRIFLVM